VGGVGGVGVWGCGRCRGVGSLLTFDIPQTALVATLDTYDFCANPRPDLVSFFCRMHRQRMTNFLSSFPQRIVGSY
jgi:hypothetical protein